MTDAGRRGAAGRHGPEAGPHSTPTTPPHCSPAWGFGTWSLFGGSSGGIVAVQLAIRHPALVRRALVYEPGYLRCVPEGEELHRLAIDAVRTHLESHPRDWAGAYAAVVRVAESAADARPDGFLEHSAGTDWYAQREAANSEAMVRDDVPILTAERIDEAALASLRVEVRFAHGTGSPALFRVIATRLAAVRGDAPDVIESVDMRSTSTPWRPPRTSAIAAGSGGRPGYFSRNSAACTRLGGADFRERRTRVWGPPVGPSRVHEARSVGRVPRATQHAGVGGVERRATVDERHDVVERQVARRMRQMLGTIARAHVAVLADVACDHPLGRRVHRASAWT